MQGTTPVAWRDLFGRGRKAANAYDLLRDIYAQFLSRSGRRVDQKTAIEVSTVFACARIIGNGMAQAPLKLMQESADGRTRAPAKAHPLYRLMARQPNPWQTSFDYRQLISWHVELFGYHTSFINRSVKGEILELVPFEPNTVTVKQQDDRSLSFEVRAKSGATQVFPQEAIWYVRGPSWNGWEAIEPIRAAREAIGLALSIEETQASMQKNGVRTTGLVSVEGKMQEGQYAQLKDWIVKEHAGAANSGVPLIMDRAAKWSSMQMTGVEAETIATRKHQVEEICRFFGVMPIVLGFSDKASTYASAEQMFLAHAVHCLAPRWTMYEQSADSYLLTEKEREAGYYFDFVEEGMIRGSAEATMKTILGYVNGGLITPNEGREKLDLNPDTDPASDKLRTPVNVAQGPGPSDSPSL